MRANVNSTDLLLIETHQDLINRSILLMQLPGSMTGQICSVVHLMGGNGNVLHVKDFKYNLF